MQQRRGTTPWERNPPQTANLGRVWRSRKSTERHICEIILYMFWFVTHYVTNQNPYKKTAMRKHSGLFVVRPTGFEPAAFRVGVPRHTMEKGGFKPFFVGCAQIRKLYKKPAEPFKHWLRELLQQWWSNSGHGICLRQNKAQL